MWTKISDCGKQLTLHSKLREQGEGKVKLYEITEVEFDQYKVELIETNEPSTAEKLQQVLSCKQLIQYGFEVETEN